MEEIVYPIFSYYACIPKVKLNTNWQISILSKIVCIVEMITSITVLYWVENFLAKKVGLVTKNIPLDDLKS